MRRLLALLFVLFAAQAWAQTPSVGSQNFADAVASDTALTLSTVASGNTIIAAYLKPSASNRTVTVTDSVGSSYSLLANIGTCTAAACIEVYVAHNVAGAGGTVTVTFDQSSTLISDSAQALEVECSSVCSSDTSSSIAESATTSHVCSADATVIDTSANVLVYAAAGLAGSIGTDTAGAGYTEGTDSSSTKFFQWISSASALTNERGAWTSSNSVATSCVIIAVKITTAAPPPPTSVTKLRPRFAVMEAIQVDPNPQPLITGPTNQSTYGTSNAVITVSGSCNDDNACTAITYACTGTTTCSGTASGTATWTFNVTLTAGATTITVTASDAQAHTATDALAVTYTASDVTAPVATISTNSGNNFTATSSPQAIAASATDAVGVVSVAWSNAGTGAGDVCTFVAGTSVTAACSVPLTSGSNALTITACDQAANCGTDTITVTLTITISIDQTSLGNQTSGQAGSRVLTATGGTSGNVWINVVGGTTINDADADCAGVTFADTGETGTITWTSAVAAGTCSFQARVTDSGANTDTNSLSITFVMGGSETSHQYFDAICALPEKQTCWTLRDNSQHAALGSSGAGYWHYYTGAVGDVDPYSDPLDALKLSWPASLDKLGPDQLRFPVNVSTGSILLGFDSWYGPEWRLTGCGGVLQPAGGSLTHKQYQAAFGAGGVGDGSISVEFRHKYDEASTCASNAALDNRTYLSGTGGAPISGVVSDSSFRPGGEGTVSPSTLMQPHSTWMRNIVEVTLNEAAANFTSYNTVSGGTVSATPSPGLYHMVSWWTCFENVDCQRLMYKAPHRRQVNGIANGRLTFSGTAGTVVPLGTTLTHPTSGVTYTTNAACTISATTVTGDDNCASVGGNTARIKVTATTFTEEGFLATGGVMTISSPPMGVNSTATAFESIGADIRDGFSKFWFELDTSTAHNQATGTVTFTGTNGTIVPKAQAFLKTDGTRYVTLGSVTISGGSATAAAKAAASYAGPAGNATQGTAFTVTSPPAGIDVTATAATAFTGGSYFNAGPLVSYYRNFWILRNYTLPTVPEDDTVIFKKPVR